MPSILGKKIRHLAVEYHGEPFEQVHVQMLGGVLHDARQLGVGNVDAERAQDAPQILVEPIQTVDLAQAIADKKIDMMLTSNQTGIDTSAWNGMKYYYKVNAWIPKNIVFINKRAFAALPPAQQKTLLADAARAEERGWKWSSAKDGEFEARLAAHWMLIANVNPYVRRFLDITGERLVHEYLGKIPQAESAEVMRILVGYSMAHAR